MIGKEYNKFRISVMDTSEGIRRINEAGRKCFKLQGKIGSLYFTGRFRFFQCYILEDSLQYIQW